MNTKKTENEFDLLIFGATGFTGKYVVEYVAKIAEKENLCWAVAGRNVAKLKEVLAEVSDILGKDIKHITTVEADVGNEDSLKDMCKRCKLVVNCAGPYRFYGEQVVKACVENGSHHVDLSAEAEYLETMQLKYHEKAQQAKVYIIGAVGYDSIPTETGIQFLQENFNGDVNSVEVIYDIHFGPQAVKLNYATYTSLIHHFANESKLISIRKELFKNPLPESNHPIESGRRLAYRDEAKKWCVSLPHTDKSSVDRTQYYNYHNRKMRPVHLKEDNIYMAMPNIIFGIFLALFFPLFMLLIKIKWGRDFLLKHPRLFSLGAISKSGPTREQLMRSSFYTYITGYGYGPKLSDLKDTPNKKMTVCVSGPEPGYIATSIFLIQSALTILQEKDKLPDEGGVYSAGAAFLETKLIPRLKQEGIEFKIVN